MKNTVLVRLLIVAVCFLVVFAVVHLILNVTGKKHTDEPEVEPMVTKTYEVEKDFGSISILSETEDVTFIKSDGGGCRVVCFERNDISYDVSVRGNKLSVRRVEPRKRNRESNSYTNETPSITVYLPQTEYASLYIENSTGNITVPEEFSIRSMDLNTDTGDVDCLAYSPDSVNIETDTGDVRCGGFSSKSVRIETDTGDIDLEEMSVGKLDLSSSNGRIEVMSVECEGSIEAESDTGKVFILNVSCGSLSSDGDVGDIEMENVIASDIISIKRSTGDISLVKCDANELVLKTDTGDVNGSLLSDKVFSAHSDLGSIDVPDTSSGGKCSITSDLGNIRITIDK